MDIERSPRELVEAVGSWLHFEAMCGRTELFSEQYLSYPIGQYLSGKYGDRLRTEFPHPVLSQLRTGRGDKPRLDFAVLDDDAIRLAVETKWLGPTSSLESILRDLVRLELVAAHSHATTYFILGGTKRNLHALFSTKAFQAYPEHTESRPLMPVDHNNTRALRLDPAPAFREELFAKSLAKLKGVDLPRVFVLQRTAPFPTLVKAGQFQIYGWRVECAGVRSTFRCEELPDGA